MAPLSPGASRWLTAPRKVPQPCRPSGGCEVSVAAQPWLQGARSRAVQGAQVSRAGPGGHAQRDLSPTVEGLAHRGAGEMRLGRSWVPIPSPDPPQTWTASQRPRPGPAPTVPAPTAPTPGSLRTPPSGPAYLERGVGGFAARPSPRDGRPQVPERAGRGVPRTRCRWRFAKPWVGPV